MKKEFNTVQGRIGEFDAEEYLKKKKYRIIAQNYKNKIGEIDLITQKDNTIVFIEVKARKTCAFGLPSESVNLRKQQKLRNVATCWLLQNKLMDSSCRFDVIEVVDDKINHIENAF